MEVTGVSANFSTFAQNGGSQNISRKRSKPNVRVAKAQVMPNKVPGQAEDLDMIHRRISAAMEEIQRLGETFSRKLKFSVNKDINKVVVKVIDATTDRVIREIPAEEVQRLQTRIRETFGLLFDEKA